MAKSSGKHTGHKTKGGVSVYRPLKSMGGKKQLVYKFRGGSLGFKMGSPAEIIEHINAGFSVALLDRFSKESELPVDAVAEVVRIPSRTLTRRRAGGRLQPDESERLLRLSMLFEKAVDLFEGDRDAAMRWLKSPQSALGGKEPLEFAKTEVGAREVEDLIGRLEHGVFT